MPAGGSCCNLLKSLINLFLAGVDILTAYELTRQVALIAVKASESQRDFLGKQSKSGRYQRKNSMVLNLIRETKERERERERRRLVSVSVSVRTGGKEKKWRISTRGD